MTEVLVQAVFDAASGLPEDRTSNTWHFSGPASSAVDNVFDMLEDFYTATPTGAAGAIEDYLSVLLAGTAEFRAYDLQDPSPRVPFRTRTWTVSPGGSAIPSEVALCVSYKSAFGSGEVAARHRGRVYLGPLNLSALNTTTGGPATALLGIARGAARDLSLAAQASVSYEWITYSMIAGVKVTGSVTEGWVDNAFDTQRRRGPAATARGVWNNTTP